MSHRADDLRGVSKLAVEGIDAITTLVEEMHTTIGSGPAVLGTPLRRPTRLMAGPIYNTIRGLNRATGIGIDAALKRFEAALGQWPLSRQREALISALNGVLGDHLEASANPLALELCFRRHGMTLSVGSKEALRKVLPDATNRLLVMVHGSSMNDIQWLRHEHDHGAALQRNLGFSTVYLRYNSGRHISLNGEELATEMQALMSNWPIPIEQIGIIGHSMGGLVTRSACWYAEQMSLPWLQALRSLVFLGTPHHGARLEQAGNWVDLLLGISRYSAPFKRLSRIRSAGVTDLRFGNIIEDHWRDRDRFDLEFDRRKPIPLPRGVASFAVAGQLRDGRERGDGLVSVASAHGRHRRTELCLDFPERRTLTVFGVGHLDLLSDIRVYHAIQNWLSSATADSSFIAKA